MTPWKRKEVRTDLADYFWRRVRKGESCWEWAGTVNRHGYGVMSVNLGQEKIAAHRYSHWLHSGTADGVVCHRCDNKRCVNPAHLFLGTQRDNMDDMTRKGRRAQVGLKGEKHPNAKLTDEAAKNIARRLREGESPISIASAFGVDRSTVYRAARRAGV